MARSRLSVKRVALAALAACLVFPCFSGAAQTAAPLPSPPPAEPPAILALGGDLFLINRAHRISKTYEPDDLVTPEVGTRKASLKDRILMRKAAATALEDMFRAAFQEAGHTLYAASGYRSFGIQQILYNSKVQEVGSREKAERRVAPPGSSEHQLGLAMDVQAPSELNLNANFGSTEEGKWVAQNAHRFGFILRYKEGWREVTGYSAEPWHIRYVGIAHATAIFQLDIPMETYVAAAALLPGYVLTGGSHPLLAGLIGPMAAGETPEALRSLAGAKAAEREERLRAATAPYLPEGTSYEQALWYAYPTPRPTAGPRVDMDEETSLYPDTGG